jgi:hypothetical protein
MKKLILSIISITCITFTFAQETLVFHEGFEGGIKPDGWNQEKIVGVDASPTGATVDWQYVNGGYFDYPDNPYQGSYNAMFQKESYNGEATILITPPLDLAEILKPELRFAHVQQTWYFNDLEYNDILNVYYKRGIDSTWVLLKSYEDPIESWQLHSIQLPDSSLSSEYYIGFEGITGYGYGTCIDTVQVIETGVISKFVNSYSIQQALTDFIPTNTTNNPILKIIIDVQGNDGNLYLDSLRVTSLNTDDNNITNNGIKLYATEDSTFKNPILIKSGVNFVNGQAWFKDINYDLPRGISTIWITYDIATAVDHDIHNNIVDAKIEEEGIFINGYAYPFADKSPEGERLLKEAIFNDTFEDDLGWFLSGSFERAIPQGLGGSPGSPDPETAYNGLRILGTDLTDDGVYSNNLTNRQDSAISPKFDCFYYKDVTIYFVRWLNIEFFDNCYLDLSSDDGASWSQIWKNPGSVIENSWETVTYELNDANFKKDVNLRFALGSTNGGNQYTGWNIDDFILVGDFISKDVGVSQISMPETGCGHTSSDDITVTIENYAGEATPASIPVRYKIDDGETFVTDAHPSSIAIGGSASFTFSVGADLSAPGFHTIMVETILSGDEMPNNNSKSKTIFSYPTYTIPYSEDFESNNGYFLPGGINSTWEYGEPSSSIIDSAASGLNAWVTNLQSNYFNNDSSFIESPCFNFAGSDSIIFEFKCKGLSEDKTDGLTILYSLNEGDSWSVVPDGNDFYWNWYNESNITELGFPGIDTTGGEWITFRQLLPPTVSNQSNVKFRFLFESNSAIKFEGFGIDDVKIYDAPADVGISSISEPVSSCEIGDNTEVKVYVENYGITTINSGEKIPLILEFNSELINDTLTLGSDLDPGNNTLHSFGTTVDMSYAADYNFSVYTKFENDQYFYNETTSNDSLYETIKVYGMPNYNPFNDLIGLNPIDTILDAGAGYITYNWVLPAPDLTASTQTWDVDSTGWHYVTVTNDSLCTAADSTEIVNSVTNLSMDSLYNELNDICERTVLEDITIYFRNKSATGYNIGDTILLGYQINEQPIIEDSIFLEKVLNQNDTLKFTYDVQADFMEPGEYTLKVFTNFLKDLNHYNDTISTTFNTWGYVDVELMYDTIYSSQADTLKLIATPGYDYYTWSTGSNNDTIIPFNSSNYYKVTVSDDDICSTDSDSTYIETHDFGVANIISPINSCESPALETTSLIIEVANYSENNYLASETVRVFYKLDNNAWEETVTNLTGGLNSLDTITLTIDNIDTRVIGEHSLKLYTSSDIDANNENDTLEYTFNTWALPDVNLQYDVIYTTKADTVSLIADPGYLSYAWNDGTTNDTLNVSYTHSKKYKVTVSDEHCGNAIDSTQIYTYNLGVSEMIAPLSACDHPSNQQVVISIKNYGNDTIKVDDVIPVGYNLEGNSPHMENFTLTQQLLPTKSISYTFLTTVDVSAQATHKFYLYTRYDNEAKTSNDTLVDAIKTFGYPTTEIGTDLLTTQPDTVLLIAESGFYGYFWNDGTQNDTLTVTYPATKLYRVTVSDINGCTTSDELTVYTYDISAESLISPVTQCIASDSEPVIIEFTNNSQDTLLIGDEINLSYSINGGSTINGSYTLTDTLLPTDMLEYEFSQNANLSESIRYEFNLLARKTVNDADTDDAILSNVDITAPDVDLGSDTVIFTSDTYEISPTDSYISYIWSTGETTSSIVISETGTYKVTVTNEYSCVGIDSIHCIHDPGIGFDDLIKGNGYSISYYPNPAINELKVEIANTEPKDLIIEIINIQGQILYTKEYNQTLNTIEQIDVNSYSQGVYYLRFRIDDKFYMRKLIIQ